MFWANFFGLLPSMGNWINTISWAADVNTGAASNEGPEFHQRLHQGELSDIVGGFLVTFSNMVRGTVCVHGNIRGFYFVFGG